MYPEGCFPQGRGMLSLRPRDALPKAKGCIPPGIPSPKPRDAFPQAGTRIPLGMLSLGPRDALPKGDALPRAEGCPPQSPGMLSPRLGRSFPQGCSPQSPGMLSPRPRDALPKELSFPEAPAPSLGGGWQLGPPKRCHRAAGPGGRLGTAPFPFLVPALPRPRCPSTPWAAPSPCPRFRLHLTRTSGDPAAHRDIGCARALTPPSSHGHREPSSGVPKAPLRVPPSPPPTGADPTGTGGRAGRLGRGDGDGKQ